MATLFGWTIARQTMQPAVRAASQLLILRGDGTLAAVKADTPVSADHAMPAVRVEIPGDDIGLAFAVQASAWAYRCIMIRAQTVSRIKRRVVNIQTGKEIPDHPLMQALRDAFRFAQSDLLFDWEMALCIWGEAYLEKIRNVFSMATGVRWLNPVAIEPFIYDGRIAWYDYSESASGRMQRFQPSEIIYHKYRNPLDDFRGLAPMTVALDSVNVDRDIQRATKAWYKNDSRPDGIVTPKGIPLNDKQYNALLAKIQEQLKGAKNRGRTFVSDSPVEWLAIQREPVPEQPELEMAQRRKIAAAIGVPLSLAGAYDDANYQSLPEQRRSLYYETVFPECDLLAELINIDVLPFFDPRGQTRFEFDPSDVKASLDDGPQKATMVATRTQSGNMTINEGRAAFNQPPLPGGDVLLIPAGYAPVPVEQLTNRVEQGSIQDETARIAMLNAKLTAGGISLNEYRAALGLPQLPNGNVFYLPGGGIQVPAEKIGEMQPKPSYQPFGNPQVTPAEAAQLAAGEVPTDAPVVPMADTAPAPEKPKQINPASEIAAWERAALNSGRNKALRFVCYNTPSVLADYVRSEIAATKTLDKDTVKDIFTRAAERLADVPHLEDESGAIKGYDDTRAEFIAALTDLIQGGLNEEVNRRRFGTVLRAQLRRLGQMAFQDGLRAGGVNDPLSDDDLETVGDWLAQQSSYATAFANEIFKDGLTDAEAASRAEAWANKSLEAAYNAGRFSADKNAMMEFVGDDGDESCETCQRLKNQRHRFKEWKRRALVPREDTDNYACGGWQCQHRLEPTDQPAKGKF